MGEALAQLAASYLVRMAAFFFILGGVFTSIAKCQGEEDRQCKAKTCPAGLSPHNGRDGCLCVVLPK